MPQERCRASIPMARKGYRKFGGIEGRDVNPETLTFRQSRHRLPPRATRAALGSAPHQQYRHRKSTVWSAYHDYAPRNEHESVALRVLRISRIPSSEVLMVKVTYCHAA
ncbi:MAG: hypothetical protein Q4G37_06595, partial [Bifidobacterium sp.]|nr:hypothetical protein [Bifidobacterium sp.]